MRTRLISLSGLSAVIGEPWVDRTRKPFILGKDAYVPVLDSFQATHILPEKGRIGRGYQKIGDIIAFHGRRPSSTEIEEVAAREKPRGVIWIQGHDEAIRTPRITLLQGCAGETTHRESGIVYRLDVGKVMFSQGNRGEKARVSRLVEQGERAGDMFAGIGYFSLSLARAGARVHAMEINPVSFQYLQQNSVSNHLTGSIDASCGDCREMLTGIYDRIHMGHFEAVSFLPHALGHSRSGTWIHVHMLGDRSREIWDVIRSLGYDAELNIHRVKKAGPKLWHQVADVVIG